MNDIIINDDINYRNKKLLCWLRDSELGNYAITATYNMAIEHNDYKWVRMEFLFQSVTVCWW